MGRTDIFVRNSLRHLTVAVVELVRVVVLEDDDNDDDDDLVGAGGVTTAGGGRWLAFGMPPHVVVMGNNVGMDGNDNAWIDRRLVVRCRILAVVINGT